MAKPKAPRASLAGRVVRPAINGKTQVIRTAGKRWSQAAETAFLTELAATCNVRAAAAAAGFSTCAIYNRRMRWPGFAAAWAAALEQGYVRIETRLVEMASDSLRCGPIDGGQETAAVQTAGVQAAGAKAAGGAAAGVARSSGASAMSVAEMMNLLKLHRASVRGGAPQDYGWRAAAPDMEAIRASILRKIEAIERADARRVEREG